MTWGSQNFYHFFYTHTHILFIYHNIGMLKQCCLVFVVFELYHTIGNLRELLFHSQRHVTRIRPYCWVHLLFHHWLKKPRRVQLIGSRFEPQSPNRKAATRCTATLSLQHPFLFWGTYLFRGSSSQEPCITTGGGCQLYLCYLKHVNKLALSLSSLVERKRKIQFTKYIEASGMGLPREERELKFMTDWAVRKTLTLPHVG